MVRLERLAIMGMLGIGLLTGCSSLKKRDLYQKNDGFSFFGCSRNTNRQVPRHLDNKPRVEQKEELIEISQEELTNNKDYAFLGGLIGDLSASWDSTTPEEKKRLDAEHADKKRKEIAENLYVMARAGGFDIDGSGYRAKQRPFDLEKLGNGKSRRMQGYVRAILIGDKPVMQIRWSYKESPIHRVAYDGYDDKMTSVNGKLDGLADKIEMYNPLSSNYFRFDENYVRDFGIDMTEMNNDIIESWKRDDEALSLKAEGASK